MIEWPESLVDEIASKRVIIFIGSGISSSSKNDKQERPPGWSELLKKAMVEFNIDDSDKAHVDDLLQKELLLDAAEVIFHDVSQPQRRTFFRRLLAEPKFTPSDFHEEIERLYPKIVITTNYDQLYERQCNALLAGNGFVVRRYTDENILDDVRSKENLIIKAHGCIGDIQNIILTRSDYFKIKHQHSEFYNLLNSLLTVNTVLFLGCSMTDPDIQLVLENTNIAAPSQHPHYAIMPKGKHPALINAMEKSYNIRVLDYDWDKEHSVLLDSLKELAGLVKDSKVMQP